MTKIPEKTLLLGIGWFVLLIELLVLLDVFALSEDRSIHVTEKHFEEGDGVYLDKDRYLLFIDNTEYRTSQNIWEGLEIGHDVRAKESALFNYIYQINTATELSFRNRVLLIVAFLFHLLMLVLALKGFELAPYLVMLPSIYYLDVFRLLF